MENFKAMIRLRASLEQSDEHTTHFMISGCAFANIPGQPLQRLFRFNGINTAKNMKTDVDKYMINSKEVLYFEDPNTGEVLNIWNNPFTGEQNEVFHTHNDPVNQPLLPTFIPPPTKLCDDKLSVFAQTVPLRYPNPLNPEAYPGYSTGNFYVASESFVTSSWTEDAYNDAKSSVPALMFWTRTSPWLPWMKMGSHSGGLFYASHSWKLPSVQDIASQLHQRLGATFPDFFIHPRPLTVPNETSWTKFKAAIDGRRDAGNPEIDLEKVAKMETNKEELLRPLAMKDKLLGLLGNKTFAFNLTGKVTIVGSPERPIPWGLKGLSTVTVNTDSDDIKVSVEYWVTVLNPKTSEQLISVPDPATSKEIEIPKFSVRLEATLSKEDIDSIYYNNLRTFAFSAKDSKLSSTSYISLAIRDDSSSLGEVLFFSATAMPLPYWMENTTSGEYCILNLCG